VEGDTTAVPHDACEHGIRGSRVQRPRPWCGRAPAAEHEVGDTGTQRVSDGIEVGTVERAVAVHEADDVGGGGDEPGEARCTEPTNRFIDDAYAERARQRTGPVRRPVVDDNGMEPGGQGRDDSREHFPFVEHREDDVDHAVERTTTRTVRAPFCALRKSKLWLAVPLVVECVVTLRSMNAPVATARVLVVEDDPAIADVVVRYLEREGYDVTLAGAGDVAIATMQGSLPDLLVLDLMLPEVDGFGVLEHVRSRAPVPVIMVTALGDESDRVVGLELGADDYITKPFSPRELVARVKAVLRRAREPLPVSPGPSEYRTGDLLVDVPAREVRRADEVIALTAREFDLLLHLLRHPRTVFSREDLLEQVWGYTYGDASTVTVHIRRLREKLEAQPSAPLLITTVWGQGYRWDG
jgi:DNA-binding response OmpR family regulator